MRKQLLQILIILGPFTLSSSAQTLLVAEDFTTDGEGTRYTANSFSGPPTGVNCSDYFTISSNGGSECITTNPITGLSGTYFWAGEDTDNASGGIGVLTLNSMSIAAYGSAEIKVLLAIGRDGGDRFEADDELLFQYNIDGGGWTTCGAFYGGFGGVSSSPTQDTDLNGTPDGPGVLSLSGQEFTFPINASGSNMSVRFIMGQNASTEEYIVDNLRVYGIAPAGATWDGSTSTDWNVASNWSTNSVPTSSDDVVIPSAPSNQPHVTLDPISPAECAALTVESGATLTVDAGKALTVSGDTDNDGTIIVKASASGIGSFIDNGTITGSGSFQMEQYLTGSGGGTPNGLFWYVSSPVASATSNVYNAAGTDKLWSANEVTQSYPEITNNSTSLNVGQGYIARLGATATKTFAGGAFNTGNITEGSLSRTGTTEQNRGYNLVGNPYPSTVDWDDLGRTNLETTMWYRTHNGSTMLFDTYNATGMVGTNNNGGGTVDGTIPPTQGFWVRVSADGLTGSVSFENADRSHGTLSSIYRTAQEEGTIRLNLSDGNVWDEQVIYFDPSATDQLDDYDSRKFWTDDVPQLYSNLQEDTLTINGLYSPQTTQMVPLGMKLPAQGDYTINASSITLTETPVYLEDTYLNIFQNMEITTVYPFSSDAGNIGDRFILHFNNAMVGIDEGSDANSHVFAANGQLNISLSPNTENANLQILDMAGRTIATRALNQTQTVMDMNVPTGVYLIRIETSKGTDTHKIILQ